MDNHTISQIHLTPLPCREGQGGGTAIGSSWKQFSSMLMTVAMLFVVCGASAQVECFEFEDGDNAIVSGLTPAGMGATELTLPVTVAVVRQDAFQYANAGLYSLTIDGGNPLFESGVLSDVASSLRSIDAGSGMTAANVRTMLSTLGTGHGLEEVFIGGFSDANPPTIKWSDMDDVLTADVHVTLPAALVSDQVFGLAEVYGRFTVSGELATFCSNASFEDDDNANMLFYVPQEYREASRQVYIKRVGYVLAGQGVLIHNATGTATFAELKRVDTGESYTSNMLVGVTTPTTIAATEGDKTNLILYQGAFHPTTGGTIAAHRAYLQISTSAWEAMGVKQLVFNFSDIETVIDIVTEDTDKNTDIQNLYDLAGRKVSKAETSLKGVYLHKGRKTFIK